MRILIVEDDVELSKLMKSSLESETFSVDCAEDGEKGSYWARINEYDLVILDFVLPKKDGSRVCEEIRTSGKDIPIIMTTVHSCPNFRAKVLNGGADDCLTKPFSFNELLARIRALLRRPKNIESQVIKIDNLTLDIAQQRVAKEDRDVYLTRKEFSLLEYLMMNRGMVVSRGMIMEHVWDAGGDPFSNTIEAHILNLRRKLEDEERKELIRTIPGRGYIMDCKKKRNMEKTENV